MLKTLEKHENYGHFRRDWKLIKDSNGNSRTKK